MLRTLPLLLTGALLVAAPAAAASSALERRAVHLGAVDYHEFLAAKAAAPPPFDWTTDGCTATPPAWAVTFDEPCQQHDYRWALKYLARL